MSLWWQHSFCHSNNTHGGVNVLMRKNITNKTIELHQNCYELHIELTSVEQVDLKIIVVL